MPESDLPDAVKQALAAAAAPESKSFGRLGNHMSSLTFGHTNS